MKALKHALILTISLVATACASTAERKPASEEGPQAQTYRLRSGQTISLPRRSDNLDYVALRGTADLRALNDFLAPEELVAVPRADGQGEVDVIVARYNSSTVGPYQEAMITVSAQPKTLKDPLPVPYYVWWTQVDLPIAKDMDREVWGFRADLGVMDLETKTTDWTFSLGNKSKRALMFEGKCGKCGEVGKQKLGVVFTLISGKYLGRKFVHAENFGPTLVRPYDKVVDAFTWRPDSSVGKFFKQVQFHPFGWFIGEGLEAVAY